MRKQPLLILFLSFVAGIFFEDVLQINFSSAVFLLISGFLLLLIAIRFLQKLRPYSLVFLFFSIGIFSHALHFKKIDDHKNDESKQEIIFVLNKKLNSNNKYKKYEVLAKVEEKNLNAILQIPKDEKQLDFKKYYQTKVFLNKVKNPDNDFQFDYAKYLARKGIYYQSFATEEILEAPKKTLSISEKIKQKRLEILETIDQSKIPKKEREFLKGIILADRTEMDAELVSDFSKSGLVHFLAISGTHLAIIFWLILYLLKPLFSAKYRKFPILISLILIWGFTIFIDFGNSVVRSSLMITAYYGFIILERKPDLLHAMAMAGFAILIFDTHQLFDVGFQLSFVAVLGIFWLNEPILKHLPRARTKIQDFLLKVIAVSIAAQIATLPLVIFYFHQYSILSIVANIIIVPFSEIIIIFSLLMTVLFSFKIEFSWLSLIYENLVNILLKVIHFFAEQDWFFIKNIPLNILEVILLYVVIFLLRNVLFLKNKAWLRFVGFTILFFAVRIFINFYQYNKSETLIIENYAHQTIVQKEGKKAIFWIDKTSDRLKVVSFLIEPYITSRRINQYEIRELPEGFSEAKINGKLIR